MYLTQRQLDVLSFVQGFREEHFISPTLQEIAVHLGKTKITIHDHLNQLEKKGAIRREKFRSRSIEVLIPLPERKHPSVPITGLLREGSTIEALDEPQDFDPRGLLPVGPRYQGLIVRGNSLASEHIADGDLVLLERREPADGEVVVALCDDRGATLGRLYHEDRRLRLQSSNGGDWKRYPKTLEVRGVVVGVLRRFPCPA